MIKMRGNNPILALKLHILLRILDEIYSVCPSNLYNSSSFDETIKMRGNNPILAIKTTHFALYLDEIYLYTLQTFITHLHLPR